MDEVQISFDDMVGRGKRLNISGKPCRLIELFGGIGSQHSSFQRLADEGLLEYESWKLCEIDKYQAAIYNAIHGTDYATSDITKVSGEDLEIVNTDKYNYIVVDCLYYIFKEMC